MDSILKPSSSSCTVDKFGVAKYEGCFDDDQNFNGELYLGTSAASWVFNGMIGYANYFDTSFVFGVEWVDTGRYSFFDNLLSVT